jgi:hydroxyacylglutathione hydrolase
MTLDQSMLLLTRLLSRSGSAITTRPFHFSASSKANMRVIPIPVRKDNYSYLIVDDTANEAAAVDPYTPSKVKEAADQLGVKVVAGITTHHHDDHSGGNQVQFGLHPRRLYVSLKNYVSCTNARNRTSCVVSNHSPISPRVLKVWFGVKAQLFPGVPIYGGSHRSPALTQLVKGDDQFTIGNTLNVKYVFLTVNPQFCPPLTPGGLRRCLATPCHTQDSICYYVTDSSPDASTTSVGAVFTGDTLFIAGCGVFFEGTGAEMHTAFERLSALPDATLTYVGHEYTAGNLRFALSVDPKNAALARLGELVASHPVTVGRTTIGDEKEWNVFWRLTSEPVRYVTNLNLSLTPSISEIYAFVVSPSHNDM